MHAQLDMSALPILGKILSHSYLGSGLLPLRIAFPTLAALLDSEVHAVSDDVLVETFLCALSATESSIVKGG